MNFLNLSASALSAVLAGAALIFFAIQFAIGFFSHHLWQKFVIPLIWLIACVFFAISNNLHEIRDYLMILLGFFILLVVAGFGEDIRKKRESKK
ncbi:hypothetical protein RQN30_09465 [Arcanobacterium hippocoleae]